MDSAMTQTVSEVDTMLKEKAAKNIINELKNGKCSICHSE